MQTLTHTGMIMQTGSFSRVESKCLIGFGGPLEHTHTKKKREENGMTKREREREEKGFFR